GDAVPSPPMTSTSGMSASWHDGCGRTGCGGVSPGDLDIREDGRVPITPLPLPAGPAVLEALPSLERALTGTAPIRPHAPDDVPTLPDADLPADLAVAIATSGSTGTPKLSLLTAANLIASAEAT